MSAPAFTPGPWEAEAITSDSAPNERPWVGRLAEDRYAALSCGETQEEAVANANLIASAPDMVAALDHYADQLCEGWCEQSPDCAHFDDCGGCLARRVAWQARGGAR